MKKILENKVYSVKFAQAHVGACFLFSHGNATPLGNGVCGSPHFSEVCTVSQITALRRYLSASVDIQRPLN